MSNETLNAILAELREINRKQDLILSRLPAKAGPITHGLLDALAREAEQSVDLEREVFQMIHAPGKDDNPASLADRIEIERLLAQVRDTVIPGGEDTDFYARMVIDLGAYLLRGTGLDVHNAAVNRGFRFYIYEDQKAGYLVILLPDLFWANRVNAKNPNHPFTGIFSALVFTRLNRPSEKEIDLIMEEVLHKFHATNRPGYTGIGGLSDFKGTEDLKYPRQGLNYDQPILNLGFHSHHYKSFDLRALVAPTHLYGNL